MAELKKKTLMALLLNSTDGLITSFLGLTRSRQRTRQNKISLSRGTTIFERLG